MVAVERLDWQRRLFGSINQVGKERLRKNGSWFRTFVHVQIAGHTEGKDWRQSGWKKGVASFSKNGIANE
jgi:hypothetical protein